VAADLNTVFTASTTDEAQIRLQEFDDKWGQDYPTLVKSWRSNWSRITPFFDHPPGIRRIED
jgi:putative transposase